MDQATGRKVISFDCYGTLVDWERGLSSAITSVLKLIDPAQIPLLVASRADAEWNILTELEEFDTYRNIVSRSLLEAGQALGIEIRQAQAEAIAATIGQWPFFPETAASLARLAERYKLAVVSNVGQEDLESTLARLDLPISHTVSADSVQCYKPEPDHLMALLHEMELDEEQLLHVSAYVDYDLSTAQDLGIPAAYIDRLGEEVPDEIELKFRVRDLAELADRLLRPPRRGLRRRGKRS